MELSTQQLNLPREDGHFAIETHVKALNERFVLLEQLLLYT